MPLSLSLSLSLSDLQRLHRPPLSLFRLHSSPSPPFLLPLIFFLFFRFVFSRFSLFSLPCSHCLSLSLHRLQRSRIDTPLH
uniref:Uncharacterized protein n=1 Tax=Nelumbo nucifera TaxID=4432 RepID=A0A822YWD6_NELNU|nr:TPA_asm: hypothetical protein HUJ06_006309 [Nelumbo nucifera]